MPLDHSVVSSAPGRPKSRKLQATPPSPSPTRAEDHIPGNNLAEMEEGGMQCDETKTDDDEWRAVRHQAATASPFFGSGWRLAIKGEGTSFAHVRKWITRLRLLLFFCRSRGGLRGVGRAANTEPRGELTSQGAWYT